MHIVFYWIFLLPDITGGYIKIKKENKHPEIILKEKTGFCCWKKKSNKVNKPVEYSFNM